MFEHALHMLMFYVHRNSQNISNKKYTVESTKTNDIGRLP